MHLYKCLGISKKTVEKWLFEISNNYNSRIYQNTRSVYKCYHMVTDTNDILLSKLEIVFYNYLKKFNITNVKINKPYPNSKMKYDFCINDNIYIELAGLLSNKIYKSKILYKRDTFKCFVLKTVSEFEHFIKTVIIEKNKNDIEYYHTRPL